MDFARSRREKGQADYVIATLSRHAEAQRAITKVHRTAIKENTAIKLKVFSAGNVVHTRELYIGSFPRATTKEDVKDFVEGYNAYVAPTLLLSICMMGCYAYSDIADTKGGAGCILPYRGVPAAPLLVTPLSRWRRMRPNALLLN